LKNATYNNLIELLKGLKSAQKVELEKDEFRKKYETYKKMYIDVKAEKDMKAMELENLKVKVEAD